MLRSSYVLRQQSAPKCKVQNYGLARKNALIGIAQRRIDQYYDLRERKETVWITTEREKIGLERQHIEELGIDIHNFFGPDFISSSRPEYNQNQEEYSKSILENYEDQDIDTNTSINNNTEQTIDIPSNIPVCLEKAQCSKGHFKTWIVKKLDKLISKENTRFISCQEFRDKINKCRRISSSEPRKISKSNKALFKSRNSNKMSPERVLRANNRPKSKMNNITKRGGIKLNKEHVKIDKRIIQLNGKVIQKVQQVDARNNQDEINYNVLLENNEKAPLFVEKHPMELPNRPLRIQGTLKEPFIPADSVKNQSIRPIKQLTKKVCIEYALIIVSFEKITQYLFTIPNIKWAKINFGMETGKKGILKNLDNIYKFLMNRKRIQLEVINYNLSRKSHTNSIKENDNQGRNKAQIELYKINNLLELLESINDFLKYGFDDKLIRKLWKKIKKQVQNLQDEIKLKPFNNNDISLFWDIIRTSKNWSIDKLIKFLQLITNRSQHIYQFRKVDSSLQTSEKQIAIVEGVSNYALSTDELNFLKKYAHSALQNKRRDFYESIPSGLRRVSGSNSRTRRTSSASAIYHPIVIQEPELSPTSSLNLPRPQLFRRILFEKPFFPNLKKFAEIIVWLFFLVIIIFISIDNTLEPLLNSFLDNIKNDYNFKLDISKLSILVKNLF